MSSRLVCMIPLSLLVTGLFASYSPGIAVAQDKPAAVLPKAETLFETYLEVSGGKKAYEKLKTRTASGSFEIDALGIKGKIQTWQKAPDLLRSSVDMGEFGKSERGVTNGVAWEISPPLGAGLLGEEKAARTARILEGAERAFLLREATFNADLNWRKICASAETVGEELVSDKPAWKVKVQTHDGALLHLYYDQYSSLLVRLDASVKTALGEVDVQVYPSDYRKSGGILVPHKSTQKMLGITQTATFESITFNSPISDQKFSPPDEVRKLLEAQPQKKTKKPQGESGERGEKPGTSRSKQKPPVKP